MSKFRCSSIGLSDSSQAILQITKEEKDRLLSMTSFENRLISCGIINVVGVDEAGRGPLAGPVVAACVLYHVDLLMKGLNDSKKLTPSTRASLYNRIISHKVIKYGVGIADAEEIDRINILQATLLAMQRAIDVLSKELSDPNNSYFLIDGNQLPNIPYKKKGIIRGDQKSLSIAAASIIAKETRDQMMDEYHNQYPEYCFNKHKGYGTKIHKEALVRYGPCPIHRKSFRPVFELL